MAFTLSTQKLNQTAKSPDVTSIEMEADSTSPSLDSTLWQSSDDRDGIVPEAYRAVAKSKGVAGKLEALIFLHELV